ncbi:MAG: energy transducer TonB [Deltaproteobacteria bacterium]|nr:energy transducer TonB [Deltaproteobacteria bacterium]
MRNRTREKFELFLLLSVLLHLVLLILFREGFFIPQTSKVSTEVELILAPPHQIADIAKPLKEEKPDQAKFMGLYDTRADQEQVARTPLHHRRVIHPSEKLRSSREEEVAKGKKVAEKNEKGGKGEYVMRRPEEKGDSPKVKETLSSEEAFPEDFYPDYKVGDHTYLNVLRYPNVAYFVRLKKIFKMTFDPVSALRESTYQISRGQIEVVLGVSVDRTGRLSQIGLLRSSGISRYDQEALRTIRDSSPFAAPPQEFLDASGQLRMSWTFTVYL